MQFSKNVSRGITYVLVVVIVVAASQLVVGDALGSSPVYVVVSGSMTPTLEIGDLVIAQPVAYSNVHVGDVIIYQQPTPEGTCPNPGGLTIVHRVVEITSKGLITQGDNRVSNPQPDEPYAWPPLPASCVKGLVVLALPYLGLISKLIPSPWNYVLVGLILFFVFLSELRPSGKGKSAEQAQDNDEARLSGEVPKQAQAAPPRGPDTSLPP